LGDMVSGAGRGGPFWRQSARAETCRLVTPCLVCAYIYCSDSSQQQ